MPNIQLTDLQKKNLLIFLNRTKMDAVEVPAFVSLLGAINAKEEPSEEKTENKKSNK